MMETYAQFAIYQLIDDPDAMYFDLAIVAKAMQSGSTPVPGAAFDEYHPYAIVVAKSHTVGLKIIEHEDSQIEVVLNTDYGELTAQQVAAGDAGDSVMVFSVPAFMEMLRRLREAEDDTDGD